MTEVLTSGNLDLNHLMCSQSGNTQDLADLSGHSPSLHIIRSDAESSSSSRQEFTNPPSLPSDMGMRYMLGPAQDDVRYAQDSGTSNSPGYSIEPPVQNSQNLTSSSSFAYNHINPYNNVYNSAYSSGGSAYFSPPTSVFSMPDIKPRLGSYTSPGLASLSRTSSVLPQISSQREVYNSATPHQLRRNTDFNRSPSLSGNVRGVPLSPTSSGFTSPVSNMDSSLGGSPCPPLGPTEVLHDLRTSDGNIVRPEIFGRIDKGFFMADNDWTCYRRNYFSLNCSYTLSPSVPNGSMYLIQSGHPGQQVRSFAMSIAAVVDGRDGKAIELVQHTPKRDKGPQEKPARIALVPRPAASHGMYSDSLSRAGSLYESPGFSQNPNQPAMEATFERIQFKNATANNGKRRAAQQYYHLLVELFADVGTQQQDHWVKIASRMSAPMVVRGRSPGHYQSERRGSNTSTGPGGGGGGAGGAGAYPPGGSSSRTPGDIQMGGTSSMLPGSGYASSYDTRTHHYRSATTPLQMPMESVLLPEESKPIEESPCYMYYPGPMYEGHHEQKYTLPSMSEYTTAKVKPEYHGNGYSLPSLASTHEGGFGRSCGRWEGVEGSKGYYPTAVVQHELNMT